MTDATASEAVTSVWRRESPRIVAALVRMTHDLGLAEDAAQDALVAALEQWPGGGIPDRPAAWLMTTAKRRAIDAVRRSTTLRRRTAELERAAQEVDPVPDLDDQVDHIEDDVLRLMFLCCHPALTPPSRAALTLRMVGGLTTAEIARGFLVPEATMGQRISRAKRTLADARAQIDVPTGAERTARLRDVMAVVYLVFNEGYAATAGEAWTRPDLAAEAVRLAAMLADLAPGEPEAQGLHALLELQGSRLAARTDVDGGPVLLEDQDRDRWDRLAVRRGLAALARAERLGADGVPLGAYCLQAAIAAQHARAASAAATDWKRIAGLYDLLARAAPGPVVEVNRAVAHGRAHGPVAGLAVLEALEADALPGSPLVAGVRGDLLDRCGRHDAAAQAFDEAASRTRNTGERALLERRAAAARRSSR
jgi:RNA polymerase sigma factor (sigma-70 family)